MFRRDVQSIQHAQIGIIEAISYYAFGPLKRQALGESHLGDSLSLEEKDGCV
jgi:hypothetical protein